MKRTIIAITGTPGVGKTSLADELSLLLHADVIRLNTLVKHHAESYDNKRHCYVVDTSKLGKIMETALKSCRDIVIVESHLAHHVGGVDCCIVVKCEPYLLRKRLAKRPYSEEKIRENVDSEIFDVCLVEAQELGLSVMVVDSSRHKPAELARQVLREVRERCSLQKHRV